MKKNLRIVSVAPAALLAVAPVATSVVPTVGANVVQAKDNKDTAQPTEISADNVYVNSTLKKSDITPAWVESNLKLSKGRVSGASQVSIHGSSST